MRIGRVKATMTARMMVDQLGENIHVSTSSHAACSDILSSSQMRDVSE